MNEGLDFFNRMRASGLKTLTPVAPNGKNEMISNASPDQFLFPDRSELDTNFKKSKLFLIKDQVLQQLLEGKDSIDHHERSKSPKEMIARIENCRNKLPFPYCSFIWQNPIHNKKVYQATTFPGIFLGRRDPHRKPSFRNLCVFTESKDRTGMLAFSKWGNTFEDGELVAMYDTFFSILSGMLDLINNEKLLRTYSTTTQHVRARRKKGNKKKRIAMVTDIINIDVLPGHKQIPKAQAGDPIQWEHCWEARGHWRRIPGNTLGKDETGERNVLGKTWVKESIRGNKDGPLITKNRVITHRQKIAN